MRVHVTLSLAIALAGCSDDANHLPADAGLDDTAVSSDTAADVLADASHLDTPENNDAEVGPDGDPDLDSDARADVPELAVDFTAMTFNGGTTPGLPHDDGDGYTQPVADLVDELYENSLSWNPAEAVLIGFLADRQPGIVAFQEIFYDDWCADIPFAEHKGLDLVCEGWTEDRLEQPRRLLGPDYDIACADGQDDNCVGVHRSVGRIVGCSFDDDRVCRGVLAGMAPLSGCSRGARVGRLVVQLRDGRELIVVNVHGTSGFEGDDIACRVDQFRQIFVDDGSGVPAANGSLNLVLGDFNTDPLLLASGDASAQVLVDFAVDGPDFRFLSPTDTTGPGTYSDLFRIDHIISDIGARGDCAIPGSTDGTPALWDAVYWDHRPVLCDVELAP